MPPARTQGCVGMMFVELYAARRRMAAATPGSREWWRAIRDIRAARQRIQNFIDGVVKAFRAAAKAAAEAFEPLIEAAPWSKGGASA